MTEVPLARLLAMAYRMLVDRLHERLAERGWTDVRPAFGFVLLALRAGPVSLRDLPGALGTSKQAVSKLVAAMVAAGYVERAAHPADARAKQVQLSDRGRALLTEVEQIWADLEQGWSATLGAEQLSALRSGLETVVRTAHGERCPPFGRSADSSAGGCLSRRGRVPRRRRRMPV